MSWVLQRVILAGYIDWDGAGWIIQSVCSLPIFLPQITARQSDWQHSLAPFIFRRKIMKPEKISRPGR
jgi:hypothetical protein